MIEKTYLILAHKNPVQLQRLIDKLKDKFSYFIIHIDKKSDIEPFTNAIKGDNILFLTNRINCLWGDFSQIIATIRLMEEAIKSKREGMIIHLTGQDYPVKSLIDINRFLEKNINCNFIDSFPIEEVWKYFYDRTEMYKFNLSDAPGDYLIIRNISRKTLKLLLKGKISIRQFALLLKKRKLKLGLQHYGGSAWWAFNSDTLTKIYHYTLDNYEALHDYYQYTIFPDEIFFQTIIKHLQKKDPSIQIAPSLTYVNWTRNPGAASPLTFTISDVEELQLLTEDKLFARKFDISLDEKILDALDKINGFAQ